jgi:hypothetical protein
MSDDGGRPGEGGCAGPAGDVTACSTVCADMDRIDKRPFAPDSTPAHPSAASRSIARDGWCRSSSLRPGVPGLAVRRGGAIGSCWARSGRSYLNPVACTVTAGTVPVCQGERKGLGRAPFTVAGRLLYRGRPTSNQQPVEPRVLRYVREQPVRPHPDEERVAVVGRLPQPGQRPIVVPERGIRSWTEPQAGGEHLHGDVAAEPRVAGPIDLAHAAGAERGDDFVWTQTGPGRQHRVRPRAL